MDIADLGLRIRSDDARRAARDLDKMTDEARAAERQSERLTRSSAGLGTALGVAAGAAGAFFAAIEIRDLIRSADEFQQLKGRIDLFSESAEQTRQIIAGLDRTAFQLGTTMSGVSELYARLAPSQDQLGYSAAEMLSVSEAVTASFIVSGASALEAQSAIIQLSQGLASGALRGEEFNSVAEQSPRIMRILSDELDMTVGELRAFAMEGGLTADVVGGALLGAVDDLRGELNDLPLTVERASQSLKGELSFSLQTFNDELGITQGLARGIMGIATGMRQGRVGLEFEFMSPDEIRSGITALEQARANYVNAASDEARHFIIRSSGMEDLLGRETLFDLQNVAERDGISYSGAFLQAVEDRIAAGRAELFDFVPGRRVRETPPPANDSDAGNGEDSGLSQLLVDAQTYLDQRRRMEASAQREAEYIYQQVQYLREAGVELDSMLVASGANLTDPGFAAGTPFEGTSNDPMLAGAGVELASMMAQYQQRLDIVRQMQEMELLSHQEAADRRVAIEQLAIEQIQQLELDRSASMVGYIQSSTQQGLNALKTLVGESSGLYKAMFLANQAASVANTVVNTEVAATRALAELGPIAGPPAAMAMRAAGYLSVAAIAAQTVAGFQSGGYTGNGGISDIAGVVHGQEYVLNNRATSGIGRDNLDYMNRHAALPPANDRAANDGGTHFNFSGMTINAGSDVSRAEVMAAVKEGVRAGIESQGPAMVRQTLTEGEELAGRAF